MAQQILGPTGRPLQSTRPASANFAYGEWMTQSLTDRWTDATEDGVQGYLKSFAAIYSSQPVVATAVDKLSRRVATLPFGAYTEKANGERNKVGSSDSLATLIAKPWPRASTVDLLHHVESSLLVHGNALLVKVRLDGRDSAPNFLYPLDWASLSAYGPQGGQIEWWSTTQFGGQERWVPVEETLHFSWNAPSGSEIGISPLEKLGVTVRLDDAVSRHQTAMFRNGSRPSLGITVDQENPRREFLDYARERVEATHKGVDNSGRTIFMGANVKAQVLSLSPVEVELIEQRRLNREEVGMVYDLAGPLMGDLTHGTYSNVEELLKSLYRDVIPPWTELIVQTFQSQLIDVEESFLGEVVRFDYTDKLKGEPDVLANTLKVEVEAGLITRNEAREILGYPKAPDPEADQLTLNANNQAPVADISKPDPAPVAPAPPAAQPNTPPVPPASRA